MGAFDARSSFVGSRAQAFFPQEVLAQVAGAAIGAQAGNQGIPGLLIPPAMPCPAEAKEEGYREDSSDLENLEDHLSFSEFGIERNQIPVT